MASTKQKRIQSFAFLIAISVSLLLSAIFIFSLLSGSKQVCEVELDNRINPNDAPIASMIRLPGIGLSRATAIVAYREQVGPGQQVFTSCIDLEKVKGIGPVTAKNICQYLRFD